MKTYDRNYYVVKADEVEKSFDANGFSKTELLPECTREESRATSAF